MRKAILILALIVAGCSKQAPDQGHMASDMTANEAASGPDVAPTNLPGVALTYAYSFLLPPEHVAETQEQHAMQCEALGPSRCRITGLEYHAANRNVWGSLSLKLAPDIARRFGKQGVATVVQKGGMLSDSEIDSVDAGTTIAAADRDAASMTAEQKQIIGQLAKPGLGSAERTQLQQRAQSLGDAQRQVAASRADAALLLASTPMKFNYASGRVDPGLRDGPFVGALKDGWSNVIAGSLFLLSLLITLIPWIVILVLIFWLWRRFGSRIGMGHTGDD